jgi:hypothetical protein
VDNPGKDAPPSEASATDPVVEAYKRDVDRTLLLENLKKTPHERMLALIALQKLARDAHNAEQRTRGHCSESVARARCVHSPVEKP